MFFAIAAIVAVLTGQPTVRDGNHLLFGDIEIWLQGLETPDGEDNGSPEAKANLEALIEGKLVTCHLDGSVVPWNKQPIGICYVDNQDLGFLQVRQGFGRDCAVFSKGRYGQAEALAKADGNDLEKVYTLPEFC